MKRWMQVLAVSAVFALPLPMVWADAETDRAVQREMENFDKFLVQGQGQQAMQTYMAARNKYPTHVLIKAYEGKILIIQNNLPGAQTALAAALAQEPHHPLATALMANLEFRSLKADEARKRVEEALAIHPESWELLQISGEMYMTQERLADAEPIWIKILNLKDIPAVARQTAHVQYGVLLGKQKKHTLASDHLNKALAEGWNLAVAVMYVQQLDLSAAEMTKIKAAVTDLRKKMASMSAHPQYAQVKQQVDQQLAPIEAKFVALEVDTDIASIKERLAKADAKDQTVAIGMAIDQLEKKINRTTTDQELKSKQMVQARHLKLENKKKLLEWGIEQKYDAAWKVSIINEMEKLAQGLSGEDVTATLAMAGEIKAESMKEINQINDQLIELAKAGWTIPDFVYPTLEQREVLKSKKLPENYNSFSTMAREALQNYFEPLAAKREKVELEAATQAYLEDPANEAKRKKVLDLTIERIKTLDPDAPELTSERIIPNRIWVKKLEGRSIDLPYKTDNARELAYTMWNDITVTSLKKNLKWQRLVQDYQRVLVVYPRWQPLYNRSMAGMFLGQYQQAYEDMLLMLAVLSWENANSMMSTTMDITERTSQTLKAIKVLGELAQNKPTTSGKYPSAPLQKCISDLQAGRYAGVVEYVLKDHPAESLDQILVQELRYTGHKEPLLDEMARAHGSADAARKELLSKKAKDIYNYSNANWSAIAAKAEPDPAKRIVLWKTVYINDPRHVEANFELAKQAESEGKKVEAMVHYNVAANGQPQESLTGLAKTAAQSRDRLEGPTPDFNSLARLYQEPVNQSYKKVGENINNKADAAITLAIANRLASRNARMTWVLPRRVDSYRNLSEHKLAIADAQAMLEESKDNHGLYHAIIADNYRFLADYPKAIEHYHKSVELEYKHVMIHHNLGLIHTADGDYEKALAEFDKGLQLDPNYVSSLLNRSKILEYIYNRDKEALADAEKALKLQKEKNPDGHYMTLELRISNLRMKIARQDFESYF